MEPRNHCNCTHTIFNKNSNSKYLISNTAITLIALIITIIILLILSAITLNFVIGDNGIIDKALLALV